MNESQIVFPPRPADLDNTVPHHADTYRAHKRRIQEWQDQCNAIRAAARKAEEEASRPVVPNEDEIYALRLAEHQRLTEARLEREAQAERSRLANEQYLSETPPTVTVSATNLYAFLVEVAHRGSQGYEIDPMSVESVGFNFFSTAMTRKSPVKKAGKA
ncbi:MAG: hypothetical protein PGN26_11470 [Xylophilus ampelinus]